MGQYYYAVSSLPYLHFDSEVYPSHDEFIQLCEHNLSRSDMRELARIDVDAGPALRGGRLKKWFDWNRSLAAELAILRAEKLGLDTDAFQRVEKVSGTEELAREIFGQGSPLTAEEVLERARWAFLEELEVGHYFDLQKLMVYGLKVSILERKAQFDTEAGLENFKRIYSAVSEGKIGEQPE